MPTVIAAFGRGIPLVDLDKVASIPCCLIGQKGHELTPTHVTDSFSKAMIFDHVLDLQTLDADRLIFTDQPCRELMQEVTASISNTGVYAGDLFTGFGSILGAFLLLGMAPLCFRQFLLIFVEELGIADGLTRREDDERFQAQISPYTLFSWLKLFDIFFYQDGDKVAVCTVFGDGDAVWSSSIRQGTAPTNVQRLHHLCQGELRAIPLERIGRIR